MRLYGDGVHDDFPAIQEMLDSGVCEVRLPAPEKNYFISDTLRIHSFQKLILPRYAVIRMADNSNRPMIRNDDYENGNRSFSVEGGIWDYNNLGQAKNPYVIPQPDLPGYEGLLTLFKNVQDCRFSNMTFKDPITFCLVLDTASYFTVENIVFDFNYGNPTPENMDGVHLYGNCHYGVIRNCQGTCYDDLVAINADEGSCGPISHIEVDGIFAENCHSAVRLLSCKQPVENIHIHNVHGTYYQYCIGITKHFEGEATWYDSLVFENIHASKAIRHSIYQKDDQPEYPLICFEYDLHIKSAVIRDVYRIEENSGVPLIFVAKTTTIDRLRIENVRQEDRSGKKPKVFACDGKVGTLVTDETVTDA